MCWFLSDLFCGLALWLVSQTVYIPDGLTGLSVLRLLRFEAVALSSHAISEACMSHVVTCVQPNWLMAQMQTLRFCWTAVGS